MQATRIKCQSASWACGRNKLIDSNLKKTLPKPSRKVNFIDLHSAVKARSIPCMSTGNCIFKHPAPSTLCPAERLGSWVKNKIRSMAAFRSVFFFFFCKLEVWGDLSHVRHIYTVFGSECEMQNLYSSLTTWKKVMKFSVNITNM